MKIGFSSGNNLPFFADYGFNKIHGIEGSKTAYNIARTNFKNIKNIKLFNDDFNLHEYHNNSYDLILDRGSLTHNKIHDIKKTLQSVHNSLKTNGLLFSVIFNKKGLTG